MSAAHMLMQHMKLPPKSMEMAAEKKSGGGDMKPPAGNGCPDLDDLEDLMKQVG